MTNKILAEFYMMTGKYSDQNDFAEKLTQALTQGNKVVQLKAKNCTIDDYLQLADIARTICKKFNAVLLLATSADVYQQARADGLHLNSQALFTYTERPVSVDQLLSVSCHNLQEMQQAEKLGADILLLSPVKATASHPELEGIGWQNFAQMIKKVNCPVYALGGMRASDLADAQQAGARGVAVSSFWNPR